MLRRTVNWLYDSLNCTAFTAVAYRLSFYKETRIEFISHLSWVADDRFKEVVKREGETMLKGKKYIYIYSALKEFKFIVAHSSLPQY